MPNQTEKRAMLLGAVIGAVCGAAIGLLFQRWRASHPAGERKRIRAGQVLRLGSAIAAVVRQVAELVS